jgi:hypothetical protein
LPLPTIIENRPSRDALREVLAFDQFHHEGRQAGAFFEPVDGGAV